MRDVAERRTLQFFFLLFPFSSSFRAFSCSVIFFFNENDLEKKSCIILLWVHIINLMKIFRVNHDCINIYFFPSPIRMTSRIQIPYLFSSTKPVSINKNPPQNISKSKNELWAYSSKKDFPFGLLYLFNRSELNQLWFRKWILLISFILRENYQALEKREGENWKIELF